MDMKRVVPVLAFVLVAAACAGCTSESSSTNVSPDQAGAAAATEPDLPVVEPIDEGGGSDGVDPTVADPPVSTDPPVETVPPAPTSGIAAIYGGSGTAGFPWAPLGWWDGSAWQRSGFDELGNFINPPPGLVDTMSISSLDLPDGPDSVITGLAIGPNQTFCVGEETGPVVELSEDLGTTEVSLGFDVIGVTADWPLHPRPVRQVGIEAPIYAEVGTALFSEAPTADQGTVVQVVRADLDGDGVEEVLVTYELVTGPNLGVLNDFTGVYVRYPTAAGTVVDEFLTSYVLPDPADYPTVGRFTIAAVADLNGDGVMEVVLRNRFWESAGISVWAMEDGRLIEVMGGGCGL
ncbi:MAG: hypothetical protein ACI8V4_000301 [Ilumatobacter sp.]|jgi:hypothetical protein